MKQLTSLTLVGAGVVGAYCFGFGSKRPPDPITIKPPAQTEKVQLSSVSLRLDLETKQDKLSGIGKTGRISFEQRTPGEEAVHTCDYPVSVKFSQGKKELDASLIKSMKSAKDFRSGLFTKNGTEVKELTEGKVQDIIGDFEMVHIPELGKVAPSPKVAPLNANGVGFVLPVSDNFRRTVKLKLSPGTEGLDPKGNLLCQKIEQAGFTVKKL